MNNFIGIDQNITELWLKEHVPQNKPVTSLKVNFFEWNQNYLLSTIEFHIFCNKSNIYVKKSIQKGRSHQRGEEFLLILPVNGQDGRRAAEIW